MKTHHTVTIDATDALIVNAKAESGPVFYVHEKGAPVGGGFPLVIRMTHAHLTQILTEAPAQLAIRARLIAAERGEALHASPPDMLETVAALIALNHAVSTFVGAQVADSPGLTDLQTALVSADGFIRRIPQ